jgi:putative ABC transport system permease protein
MKTAEITENFVMAMRAVAAHKLRSALTLLGVVVGVFSIIVVMTAIRVLQGSIEDTLSGFGADVFVVQRNPAINFGGPEVWEKIRRREPITSDLGELVLAKSTLAKAVGMQQGFWQGEAISAFAKSAPNVPLSGLTPDGFSARVLNIGQGRALNLSDEENARHVCVVGSKLAETLFPLGSPLGQEVKADGVGYHIVGVLESKGAMLDSSQDNQIIIPLSAGLNRYGRRASVGILVQAPSQALYADTMDQVRGILRSARRVRPGEPDDFEMFSNDSLIGQFRQITFALRLGAALVSSIALVTAGIGIMNIMLVSVTERTREIGIRRAIGAKRRNIMTQFITEAVFLCQVGGIIGVLLGIGGGNAASVFFGVPPVIPYDWAVIGLVLCSLIGVVFGTYPAYKAAHLDPVEALRYE